jgi:DNA-binding LacI/PurR family transcriptional regulator
VHVPGYELGRLGAERLISRLGGEDPPPGGARVTLPVTVQLRGST